MIFSLRRRAVILAGGLAAVVVAGFLVLKPIMVPVIGPAGPAVFQVYGLGTVEARVLSKVGFEMTGTLVDLKADQGERIGAGTVLARLDPRSQEAKLAKARAVVQQAEANHRRALTLAEKAKAQHGQKRNVSDRRQELARKGTVSVEAAEDAGAAAAVASADVRAAATDADITLAALADAQAQERIEAVQLTRHALTVPYDAMVVSRHKELGAVLAPGEAVFTLVDPTTVWVQAYVDEALAGEVKLGQPATIRLRSLPRREFKGRVARIDVESDRVSEERRIAVVWDDPPAAFHLGEQAEVTILTGQTPTALLIPEAAIRDVKAGGGTVWTVEDGRLQRRRVGLGRRTLDGRVEITEGISGAVQVVARIDDRLRDGRRAKAFAPDAAPLGVKLGLDNPPSAGK